MLGGEELDMSDTIGSMVEDSGIAVVQEVSPTGSAVESLLDRDVQARPAAEVVAHLAASLVPPRRGPA